MADEKKPGPAINNRPDGVVREQKPQNYYDGIKAKFAEERDLRLKYRPQGTSQYTSDTGTFAKYTVDPYADSLNADARAPIDDFVEVLFIGGGFSALLTAARLRERGVESIRIVERGGDVGGTWYWNRYPGAACDVPSYDYLPLLDEMKYMPSHLYAKGPEIFAHCQNIAKKYDLYDLAVFRTTVTSTVWDETEKLWRVGTDRGDTMRAKFVICANGTLSKPKLSKIAGMETFKGYAFHTSRWDYEFTGDDLSKLSDKVVGIIGTGASAVQAIPRLAKAAKELYVFQRTPSGIDFRNDRPTDPDWAATRQPGWQEGRRMKAMRGREGDPEVKAELNAIDRAEKIRRQENSNIEYMMRIHRRIEEVIHDKQTAESLKPWYMFMCKRPCFDDEYLPAFNRPNVHLVDTHGQGISKITADGPVFDGKTYPLDVLIYATGFEVQKTGIYNRIVGRGGREINEVYADGIRTLFGVHTHGFPNLFIMGGYQASFQFNLTFMLQTQGDHIAECIKLARERNAAEIDVKPETEEWWVQEVISHRGKTSRNSECTPGYYNFEGEFNRRQDGNYNGGFQQYFEHMKTIRGELANHFLFACDTAPRYVRARQRDGKVSVATKIFQGIGALPDSFKNFAVHTFLLFYYSQVLGLSPVRASFAIGAALVVDAVIDPLVGTFSDNLKSRLGRRHLLMYASILPLGVALYFAFTPPEGASEAVLFLWLFAFATLINMAMSIYVIPWTALYAEFSDDYAERTTIVTYRYALGLVGSLIFTFSVWTFIFPSSPAFHPGQMNPAGYHLFAPVVALAVMGTVLATTYLTQHEVPYLLQPTRQVSLRDSWRIVKEMLNIFTNRDFVLLFAGALVTAGINGTTGALGIYMQTYFWGLTPENLRWFAIAVLGAVLAFAVVGPFERRLDKKTVLITCFVLLIIDGVAGVGLRLLDLLPPNGSPLLIGIMIANETTRAFLNTTLAIMFASMLADTLDLQELRTSRRQEGVFAAALSFSNKATSGVGTVMAGLILQYAVGWPAKVAPGAVDPVLVTRLGVIVGIMIPMLLFLSISLGNFYRLTRDVHADIRAQLAERRALPVEGDAEIAEREDFANAVLEAERT